MNGISSTTTFMPLCRWHLTLLPPTQLTGKILFNRPLFEWLQIFLTVNSSVTAQNDCTNFNNLKTYENIKENKRYYKSIRCDASSVSDLPVDNTAGGRI